MNTKLTLTIDPSVVEKAKRFAGERGKSLSSIIENYLRILTTEKGKTENELTPIVKSLKGSFSAPEDFDYKEELLKQLEEKYL